jgi:hypothetical protein
MFEEIKYNRRRFLGTASMTLAAAQLGMFRLRTRSPERQNCFLPVIAGHWLRGSGSPEAT